MKILVADSDSTQLEVYQQKAVELFGCLNNVDKQGISIQYCHTGSEVVSMLNHTSYDLTVMDRALLGVTGDYILVLYRQKLGKVIICSAFTNTKEICLSKPIDYEKLAYTIKEVCDVPADESTETVSEYEVI